MNVTETKGSKHIEKLTGCQSKNLVNKYSARRITHFGIPNVSLPSLSPLFIYRLTALPLSALPPSSFSMQNLEIKLKIKTEKIRAKSYMFNLLQRRLN